VLRVAVVPELAVLSYEDLETRESEEVAWTPKHEGGWIDSAVSDRPLPEGLAIDQHTGAIVGAPKVSPATPLSRAAQLTAAPECRRSRTEATPLPSP
jgi:hypothetical protein